MRLCNNCHQQILDDSALYCSKCGTKLLAMQTAPGASPARKKSIARVLLIALPLNIAMIGAGLFMTKGCSSVSGDVVSKGEPLGNFTFVPKQCRSGQRMSFFGSVLLGEGPQDGAVVAIMDPVKGKILKVEVPGSCEPPDYEKCKEVIIDPTFCSRYDMVVNRTSIMVNNIVLIDGHLNVDCAFPGGGSVKGNITFERCN